MPHFSVIYAFDRKFATPDKYKSFSCQKDDKTPYTNMFSLFLSSHCRFTQGADLRKHKKTVHEGARDYKCAECHLSFGEVSEAHIVRGVHEFI